MSTNKEQQTKNSKPIPCKLILVGDSGVGKTCIISRYMNEYKPDIGSTLSTTYFTKLVIIDGYKINFQIWDTVGQEQYRSLNSLFFKDAHICLMVFDITRKMSFESIKDYWYNAVISNGLEGIIFGLAGNKNDLYENETVDKNEVKEFSNEVNAVFKYTSAKQNVSIDELFEELGKNFLKSSFVKDIIQKEQVNNENQNFKLDNKKKSTKNEGNKKGCC